MEKEFIPYELAVEFKELGFNEPCLASYYRAGKRLHICEYINHGEYTVLAPTYSQAFRFFREKYSWQHSIDATSDQHSFELGYNYWIWNNKTGEEHHTMPKNRPTGDWEYETYEEAELECLKKLIKIIKNKN
jgi:hypothetical protein